jgi:SAM-dependent methyltransferase
MILEKDNNYWNDFYNKGIVPDSPSSFAKMILPEIIANKPLIELGCGNGRDSFFFHSNGIEVLAVDASLEVIVENTTRVFSNGLKFFHGDFTQMDKYTEVNKLKAHNIYSRFTLHSILKEDMEKTLNWAFNYLPINGKLFIEARTINDPLYGVGYPQKDNAFINTHYRRFLKTKETYDYLNTIGFNIMHCVEDYTSSWFKDDHAVVLRIIAQKVES